jgi:hypothetical protein
MAAARMRIAGSPRAASASGLRPVANAQAAVAVDGAIHAREVAAEADGPEQEA